MPIQTSRYHVQICLKSQPIEDKRHDSDMLMILGLLNQLSFNLFSLFSRKYCTVSLPVFLGFLSTGSFPSRAFDSENVSKEHLLISATWVYLLHFYAFSHLFASYAFHLLPQLCRPEQCHSLFPLEKFHLLQLLLAHVF